MCKWTLLKVCVGLTLIYSVVGHAVWGGVGVMAIIFTCTSLIAKPMASFFTKQLLEKDKRIKLLTEMLNGIKVVKLYAWEPAFSRMISKIRTKELKYLNYTWYLYAAITTSYCCTNTLVSSLRRLI